MTTPAGQDEIGLAQDSRQRIGDCHGAPHHRKTGQVIDIVAQVDHLPRVDLADLLVEVDGWTGFTRHFEHAGGREPRTKDLLAAYERPRYTPEQDRELRTMVENLARKAGMDALPQIE